MNVIFGDLRAFASLPEGTAQGDFALVPGQKEETRERRPRRLLYSGAAFSIALHFAILAYFLIRLGSAPLPPPERMGMEEGSPETLNVSVITAADLKNLSSASLPEPTPPTPPNETQPSPQPPEETAKPDSKPVKEAALTPDKGGIKSPEDPEGIIAQTVAQFAASMTRAFAAQPPRQRPQQASVQVSHNMRFSRPGASHSGKSDEFARAVAWALAGTVPQGNGVWGSSVVTFTVTASGQVEDLRLLQSSGDKWLDTGALMAVRQARMPAPPPNLDSADRTFHVEYISR